MGLRGGPCCLGGYFTNHRIGVRGLPSSELRGQHDERANEAPAHLHHRRGDVRPAHQMTTQRPAITGRRRSSADIDDRYDHRFLNEDNPDFADLVPTAEKRCATARKRRGAAVQNYRPCTWKRHRNTARPLTWTERRRHITSSDFPRPEQRCRRSSRARKMSSFSA